MRLRRFVCADLGCRPTHGAPHAAIDNQKYGVVSTHETGCFWRLMPRRACCMDSPARFDTSRNSPLFLACTSSSAAAAGRSEHRRRTVVRFAYSPAQLLTTRAAFEIAHRLSRTIVGWPMSTRAKPRRFRHQLLFAQRCGLPDKYRRWKVNFNSGSISLELIYRWFMWAPPPVPQHQCWACDCS